jgi:hypothetical protein
MRLLIRRGSGLLMNIWVSEHRYLNSQIACCDQIEKNETGWACSMYGERRGLYRVLLGNVREGMHLKDPSVDGG